MSGDVQIIYGRKELIPSYRECLDQVAREKIYLEMVEAPPLERVQKFQEGLIEISGPVCYAVEGDKVVGWADIFPKDNPRQKHRGGLGMGLLPAYRGRGLAKFL